MLHEPSQGKLKLLTSYTTAFEAEHLKLLLEAEQIPALVDGVHASNNFGFNSSMGAVQVRVPEELLARAREILEEANSNKHSAWMCAQCREANEPNFDFCWKCGGERSDAPVEETVEPRRYTAEDFLTDTRTPLLVPPIPIRPPLSLGAKSLAGKSLDGQSVKLPGRDRPLPSTNLKKPSAFAMRIASWAGHRATLAKPLRAVLILLSTAGHFPSYRR